LGVSAAVLAVVFDGRGQGTARTVAIVGACLCGFMLLGALLRGRRLVRSRRPGPQHR
jgi:hypothetical protein